MIASSACPDRTPDANIPGIWGPLILKTAGSSAATSSEACYTDDMCPLHDIPTEYLLVSTCMPLGTGCSSPPSSSLHLESSM